MKKIILCDFDGTITKQDTLVRILDKFAGPGWRLIEKKILPKYPNLEKESKKILNSWEKRNNLPREFRKLLS